jgi:hypothetical protein
MLEIEGTIGWRREASADEKIVSAHAADRETHQVMAVVFSWKDGMVSYVVTHHITLLPKKTLLLFQLTKHEVRNKRSRKPTLPKSPRLSRSSLKSRSTFACSRTCSCDRIRSRGTVSRHSAPSDEFDIVLVASRAEPRPATCPGFTSWKRTPFS